MPLPVSSAQDMAPASMRPGVGQHLPVSVPMDGGQASTPTEVPADRALPSVHPGSAARLSSPDTGEPTQPPLAPEAAGQSQELQPLTSEEVEPTNNDVPSLPEDGTVDISPGDGIDGVVVVPGSGQDAGTRESPRSPENIATEGLPDEAAKRSAQEKSSSTESPEPSWLKPTRQLVPTGRILPRRITLYETPQDRYNAALATYDYIERNAGGAEAPSSEVQGDQKGTEDPSLDRPGPSS
ncbi:unnamed protein product [Amoebophrya sp. A25]|nr:unnamed protein product [Amoebophrya sp. A25]|eukprot:GSA25T00007556001.1